MLRWTFQADPSLFHKISSLFGFLFGTAREVMSGYQVFWCRSLKASIFHSYFLSIFKLQLFETKIFLTKMKVGKCLSDVEFWAFKMKFVHQSQKIISPSPLLFYNCLFWAGGFESLTRKYLNFYSVHDYNILF